MNLRSLGGVLIAMAALPKVVGACPPRLHAVSNLTHIAVVSTQTLNVLGLIDVGSGDVVYGLSGTSDGGRIYAATSANEVVTINGNSETILRRDTMASYGCSGTVYGVAAWPDGSRLLVICANKVLLFSVSGDIITLRDSKVEVCHFPDGYDLETQPNGALGNLFVACNNGDNGGVVSQYINGNSLYPQGQVTTPCDSYAADVCGQHYDLTTCNSTAVHGGIVCDPGASTSRRVVDFAECSGVYSVALNDPGRHACAHVQNGTLPFWAVGSDLVLVKPGAGTITSVSLGFTPAKVVPNFVSQTTAYVVGTDANTNGATAEVDNNGNVTRRVTGIQNFYPFAPSPDSIFVSVASPPVCNSCP